VDGQPLWGRKTLRLAGVLIVAAAASLISPAAATAVIPSSLLPGVYRTSVYACSIAIGALPYVSAGAAAAVAIEAVAQRWRIRHARAAAVAFALLFPGCDCAMSSFAACLRLLPPGLAGACIIWSGCCNPIALVCTAAVLGPRMLVVRMCAGVIAAVLSAVASSTVAPGSHCSGNTSHTGLAHRFVVNAAGALWSLCAVACMSALLLVYRPHALANATPAAAAIFGSLLSPCSTADAVLAGAFFREPRAQIAFIFASQALDFRQLSLMYRTFGSAVMARSAAAGLAALAAACAMAA